MFRQNSWWDIRSLPLLAPNYVPSVTEKCRPYCFWLWSERSDFLCTRYDPFSFHLHYLHFITGALLDTAYIGYLFCPSRRTPNDDDSSFPATVLFGKVFLELRLALVKIFGSILFKSIQSFSPFILHFMYCVLMIISWKFCHYSFLMDPKDLPLQVSTPALEEELLWTLLGHERPVWYQYQDPAWILQPLAHASPEGYSSRRYSTNQTTYSCPGPGSMY